MTIFRFPSTVNVANISCSALVQYLGNSRETAAAGVASEEEERRKYLSSGTHYVVMHIDRLDGQTNCPLSRSLKRPSIASSSSSATLNLSPFPIAIRNAAAAGDLWWFTTQRRRCSYGSAAVPIPMVMRRKKSVGSVVLAATCPMTKRCLNRNLLRSSSLD